jgi:hypothetical protein
LDGVSGCHVIIPKQRKNTEATGSTVDLSQKFADDQGSAQTLVFRWGARNQRLMQCGVVIKKGEWGRQKQGEADYCKV